MSTAYPISCPCGLLYVKLQIFWTSVTGRYVVQCYIRFPLWTMFQGYGPGRPHQAVNTRQENDSDKYLLEHYEMSGLISYY